MPVPHCGRVANTRSRIELGWVLPAAQTAADWPPRGSGAAAPQGALRAIDPCGAAAILADLRSAPQAAAVSA
jgi:hypothetical protein